MEEKKMPPSRTFGKTPSAAELADEFEDLQFLPPNRSSPPSMKNFVTFAQSASNLSSNSNLSERSSGSGSGSGSVASLSYYNDDFTLGSRISHQSPNNNSNNGSNNNINIVNRRRDPSGQQHREEPNFNNNNNTNLTNSPSSHHYNHHYNSGRRASQPSNTYRHSTSKERYVFSNFRFLTKESSNLPKTVDDVFDWLSIEMVLVPEIENILCPICLDVPCVARFTRCGHVYCLPCLLQYFQTTEPSPDSFGNNWRNCPVCAEPLHLKQLRPVKFCPATEPREGEIFHSVLIQKPVGSLQPLRPPYPNSDLTNISPFQRVIPVGRAFVLEQILNPEVNQLRTEMKLRRGRGEESLELSFIEAAIKNIEEVKKRVTSEVVQVQQKTEKSSPILTKNEEFYYFHQSRDGLNVFLHPLCMKILKNHFETYEGIPSNLSLPIIQLERVLVNASNRKRFKYLDHLSLGTQIILVEVDLTGIVSPACLQAYQRELSARQSARDQKTAYSNRDAAARRERSILEEWKMMEDDYYSVAQVSAAMDIKVPETVKLDNLDDETSFPLPSSYNNNNNSSSNNNNNTGNSSYISIVNSKKSPSANSFMEAGSPSFSALAHSLNSPFTYNLNTINNNNNAAAAAAARSFNTAAAASPAASAAVIEEGVVSGSKKKILLFSSGLNLSNNTVNEKKRR